MAETKNTGGRLPVQTLKRLKIAAIRAGTSQADALAAGALLFAKLVDDADTDTIGAGPDAATYALNKLINEVESTKK